MTARWPWLGNAGALGLCAVPAALLVALLSASGAGWAITNLAFMVLVTVYIYLRQLDATLRLLGSAVGALAYVLIGIIALFLAATGPSPLLEQLLFAPSSAVGFPSPGSDAGIVLAGPIWALSIWLLVLAAWGIAKLTRLLFGLAEDEK